MVASGELGRSRQALKEAQQVLDHANKAFDDINYGIRKAHVKACWEFAGIDPLDLQKHGS